MSESRTKIVGARFTPAEYKELNALAEAKGLKLSEAMRLGTKQYLAGGTPETAASNLRAAVEQAAETLRSLDD